MRRYLAIGGLVALLSASLVLAFAGPATGVVLDGYFVDDNTSQFEDDIDAIAEASITRGCNTEGTRFCPDAPLTRGEMAAFLRRSLDLPSPSTDQFTDDNGNQFEDDINALAEAGITRGCDQAGTRFCPNSFLSRGEMAAFLARALDLPESTTNHFTDDAGSIFEGDINAIADAGITRGCDATRTRYCPLGAVTRGEMAAFLRRALDLPAASVPIPMGEHPSLVCPRAGTSCTLTVDVDAGRQYRIVEGIFQALPASDVEMADFNAPGTRFSLTVDGSVVDLEALPVFEEDGFAYRNFQHLVSFTAGTHTLVGTWQWAGGVIQTTTVTVRAAG